MNRKRETKKKNHDAFVTRDETYNSHESMYHSCLHKKRWTQLTKELTEGRSSREDHGDLKKDVRSTVTLKVTFSRETLTLMTLKHCPLSSHLSDVLVTEESA